MTYNETIDYLYSRLPVFHRIGPKALKPGLTNTLRLCEALGNPQHQFRSIHVAGTNGKGSTSHMLASIYGEAGYRVGLYTSPHLRSFTERIRINGQPIPEAEVVAFVQQTRSLVDAIEPSFFELTVAMAFSYFAREKVDVAIIEVGLGGRLDSTNVITPLLSVITNIGYDHMDLLGDTLPQIAAEKAGIIKPGVPVVIGEYTPETHPVFESTAALNHAPIVFAADRFRCIDRGIRDERRQVEVQHILEDGIELNSLDRVELDLLGLYQLQNLPALFETVKLVQTILPCPAPAVVNGLSRVVANTGLQGRFQTIRTSPRIILDTAHNAPGIRALFETVAAIPHTHLRIVIGMVADKNAQLVIDELPKQATYYLCKADSPRSMPVTQLNSIFAANELITNVFNNVNQALLGAIYESKSTELLIVTGSNFVISEVNLTI
ncbi:MAG: bifunctional folylpolyglutamate synthase/dihydrofolate synthase [Cytophagales bacterium]|nr:MAG: bifunctional folylpolyglutamate synthase/dihydrofolate synthase [Cytophagales bacterium]